MINKQSNYYYNFFNDNFKNKLFCNRSSVHLNQRPSACHRGLISRELLVGKLALSFAVETTKLFLHIFVLQWEIRYC